MEETKKIFKNFQISQIKNWKKKIKSFTRIYSRAPSSIDMRCRAAPQPESPSQGPSLSCERTFSNVPVKNMNRTCVSKTKKLLLSERKIYFPNIVFADKRLIRGFCLS